MCHGHYLSSCPQNCRGLCDPVRLKKGSGFRVAVRVQLWSRIGDELVTKKKIPVPRRTYYRREAERRKHYQNGIGVWSREPQPVGRANSIVEV